uniref:Uncharacterized protein n=1 Tax=Candidatus Kentrum sp. MB TaxID=2138164 RepID=A0A450XF84_9GAMM|nr:MAG: hypothetical protein BECKMB1821G_GA0114241_100542 [Candidatus Kentron sp. MB]VFK27950.1 MAG: hypothetical protein BECKMB1821I_GA0114274_100540 [Candidatus Kentron sp. MB]VFK74475.1 MAG: hypothetical protein BECKMB1821H_GA0114242_100540 [Candidatus Kentron sp. MB]
MLKKIKDSSLCFGMTKICHFERSEKSWNLSFSGVMEFLFMNVNQSISRSALQMSLIFTVLY